MNSQSVVQLYTDESIEGVTTGGAIRLSIDGVEIPGVISVDLDKIEADSVAKATVEVYVRLGRR